MQRFARRTLLDTPPPQCPHSASRNYAGSRGAGAGVSSLRDPAMNCPPWRAFSCAVKWAACRQLNHTLSNIMSLGNGSQLPSWLACSWPYWLSGRGSEVEGRMIFRKLRIAFSATCGIACVLLIVLWVRSCSWFDMIVIRGPSNWLVSGDIMPGTLSFQLGELGANDDPKSHYAPKHKGCG
jgi:hypothetical protein